MSREMEERHLPELPLAEGVKVLSGGLKTELEAVARLGFRFSPLGAERLMGIEWGR